MDFELKWTETSSSDIEAIVRYIGRRDPVAAGQVGYGIFNRAQKLILDPMLGSVELTLPSGEWRKLIFRRWKIIYKIAEPFIVVGRVWPCAMGEIDFETPLDD